MKIVKDLLKAEDRSQAWLSRKCGVTPALVSYWLNGKCIPSIAQRKMIADAFRLDIRDIFQRGVK